MRTRNACLTSLNLGKPPVDSLEKRSWPLTVTSKLAEKIQKHAFIHNPSEESVMLFEEHTSSSDMSLDLGIRNRGTDFLHKFADPAHVPSSTTIKKFMGYSNQKH